MGIAKISLYNCLEDLAISDKKKYISKHKKKRLHCLNTSIILHASLHLQSDY